MDRLSELETGDVIIFSAKTGWIGRMIKWWTDSEYSHVGMVIKNPRFPDFNKDGVFLIESTTLEKIPDVEDHKIKLGVQLQDMSQVISKYDGNIYWRKLHCDRDPDFYQQVINTHNIVHNKPYDFSMSDWNKIIFKKYSDELRTEKRFICSALVSFFLVSLRVLSLETPWSVIEPADLGGDKLSFVNHAYLDNAVDLKHM